MTLLEALKIIATIDINPMPENYKFGYDTMTENPLYGERDGIIVIVDGDILQLEVTDEQGKEDIYTITMKKEE